MYNNMNILIGSVFIDNYRSKTWYDLQLKYINRTTKKFTHSVYLNGSDNFYKDSIFLGNNENSDYLDGTQNHADGLNKIVSYFKQNINNFDFFLILDSDCFPFNNNWFNKIKNYKCSAIVRYENLHNFAHPAAMLFDQSTLENLEFKKENVTDIAGGMSYQVTSNIVDFFPLIRTNVINYHPICYGIYYDCFYHHGAGSRNFNFSSFDLKYYSEKSNNENYYFDMISFNSDAFLFKLSELKLKKKLYA